MSRPLPRLAAICAFIGCVFIGSVFAGCGTSSEAGTPTAVAGAYRKWLDSATSGDTATACSRMTDRFVKAELLRTGSASKDCAGLIKESAAFARKHPEIKKYKLSQIEVAGERATLTDQTPYENVVDTARMALIREGGRWKVDSQEIVEDAPQEAPTPNGLES